MAWLEPRRYCWVPVATKFTWSDTSPQGNEATNVAVASHGRPTWTAAIHGTVPEAEIIGAAAYLLHTPPSACTVHLVHASIIGAHLEALYRGIKELTSHLVNQHALSWIVERLRRLPRRVGRPHHWVVRQSSHLAAVLLEAPDSAAARAMTPPVHLVLPKDHAILFMPGGDGELEPCVPSMQALRLVREMEWRSLAARTRAHTPFAGAYEAVSLGAVHHGPTQRNMLRARDGRFSTMQVMRGWRQKVTRVAIQAHPCIFCGGPEEDIGHMRLLRTRDEEVARLVCRRVEEVMEELPLTDRAVEFMAWTKHGCSWAESLMAGVIPWDLKRLFAAVQATSLHALMVPRSYIAHEEAMTSFPDWMAAVAQAFSQWIGSWLTRDYPAFRGWSRVVSAQSWAIMRGTMVRGPDGQSDTWLQVYADHPVVRNILGWPREVLPVFQQPLCNLPVLVVSIVHDVGTLWLYDGQLLRVIPAVTERRSMAVLVGSKQLAGV